MSLASLLVKVGDIFSSKLGKTVLSSLGIGIVTTTISVTLLNAYINYAIASYGALGDVVGLLGLAGFNIALGLIFSALGIRMYLNNKSISFRKLQ